MARNAWFVPSGDSGVVYRHKEDAVSRARRDGDEKVAKVRRVKVVGDVSRIKESDEHA
jgi:hypothetical protein